MNLQIKEVKCRKDLKKWVDFPNKLYKNETAYYYILSFIIMNIPMFGRLLFKIRNIIKRTKKV